MNLISKLKGLPKCRSCYIVLAVVMMTTSSVHAAQKTPIPTDESISLVLTQHYEGKKYDYMCHPTLESQKKFKLTAFGGEAEIPGDQKGPPPADLTITTQDPPVTWYCVIKSPAQEMGGKEKSPKQAILLSAQNKLKELGYDPGVPDGIWGRKTEAAIKRYQQDSNLPVTGILDPETERKLSLN